MLNIKQIIQYVSHDIWFKQKDEYKSPKAWWFVQQLKVFIFTAQGFGQHGIALRSAALTFYTVMSLVPIAALVFGIAKGFGLEARMNDYLYAELPQYSEIIDQVIQFADNLLQRTKGGIIASGGLVVLFWAILKVFSNVESSFNSIWEVHKARSITRKFSDYVAVVVITPILWVISSSARLQLQENLLHLTGSPLINVLFSIFSLMMIWLMFTFLYQVMPNTKVRFKSALTAGIIAGSCFLIFQVIYLNIQSSLTSYNAIYGSFAAVPLFLIWLQTSWEIVLFGAELSFAYQNINKFEYEKMAGEMSYEFRKRATVVVMQQIVRHFIKHEGAVTSEMVAQDVNLPVRTVRDVIFDLERTGLIVSTVSADEKVNYYVPALDVHNLKIIDVIQKVESTGKDRVEIRHSEEFQAISQIMDELDGELEASAANIRVMDINTDIPIQKS